MEQYLIDPQQTQLQTTVISSTATTVQFAATIIYPGGGGQPLDSAVIVQGNHRYQVLAAERTATGIRYTLDRPLAEPSLPVTQIIAGAVRTRNTRYHTLLHLIAGLAAREYGCVVTSNQILSDHARIELQFPTHAAKLAFPLADFTATVSAAITANHSVSARIVDRDALQNEQEEVRTLVSLIPAAVNQVRLVKITGVDEEACAGTHVASTRQIGAITLKAKSKGPLKLRLQAVLTDSANAD
ncbi:alanyl-tRNA editing protein [Lacticaseibacillus songhuajiangensis]|jgi:Ser-tRNA(Ala) deacylase AlaX|uniref:alanyl-tRNA editing protein n=1 Tax=Lacticaseibacillus songhuajiangensis TaxID=1296539 RepID=UPI000F78B501|nr:alanyl-tRNA editing protein [Lacticaseibacillus songhuajiangensis]